MAGFMDLGDCESLFKNGDKDKDGLIGFRDFIRMVVPNEYHIEEESIIEVMNMDYLDLRKA